LRLFAAVCGEIASNEASLEGLQLHVTIRTPHAKIEADNEGTFPHKRAVPIEYGLGSVRADDVAFSVLQREGWTQVAGFFGALGGAGSDEFCCGATHRLDHGTGNAVGRLAGLEIRLDGVELGLQ
jgi:hypothetical protein